ncbi:MAG TPA: SRPBCC family protein [Mycobacteriales bacterium]|nr:SRPBCC family protein [Mycobacteriales bacterium]
MAVTTRVMKDLTPRQVFDVLRDGYSYGDWVVGTRHIRTVDAAWPDEGAKLHYTVGYGPLRKDDETVVLVSAPDTRLEVEARAWPAGTAHIAITAEAAEGGTLVSIDEKPHRGPAKLLHNPLLDLVVKARNVETLRRLEAKAAGRR